MTYRVKTDSEGCGWRRKRGVSVTDKIRISTCQRQAARWKRGRSGNISPVMSSGRFTFSFAFFFATSLEFFSLFTFPSPSATNGPPVHKEMKEVYKLRETFLRRCTERFFRVTAVTRPFPSCSSTRSRERRLFAPFSFFVKRMYIYVTRCE